MARFKDDQTMLVFDAPRLPVRAQDPETSVEAARRILPRMKDSEREVLAALRAAKRPLTSEDVVALVSPGISPSRARGALSELKKSGAVMVFDTAGTTARGCRCSRYVAK